ncbi:DNA-processing protein DprA [Cohnella massiliensis]|uniref:DNA-processing protein DprA n=1 Tax=Cohnella massiliensis TaxID=1816691 RepID=UPI0009BA5D56|nr:DNA-processing protein DprA [Cohnella massiliensis]
MSTFHPDREVVIAMHETEGITHDKIDRLFTEGAIDGARSRRPADWRDLGLRAKEAKALADRLRPEAIEAAIRRREKAGISIVTALDTGYPMQLRHTHRFPWVLYYIGNLALARKSSVAIVGTRSATSYGRRVAEELAFACSKAGLVVVSGMAKGIDACAHAGALQGPAGTVAVLGGPVDSPYPRENAGLYRQIAESGLVLSEIPPDMPVYPYYFPLRNRIIAGISLGVVVVEAGEKSGALHTAAYANDASRDVFVVPGPITSPRSKGGLKLLRESWAKPVIEAKDILEEYKRQLGEGSKHRTKRDKAGAGQAGDAAEQAERAELPPEEAVLYDLLLDGPKSIDELLAASALGAGRLHQLLLSLQLKQKIESRPGSVFAAI